MIKRITNIPCPSCGSTRSVSALLHGDFVGAIYWNPLGLVVLAIMIVLPIWLAVDLISKKDSLLQSYKSTEKILRKKTVAIPLIILVIINWIWNIYKNV
jgi:cell division protein FtsW (lipid II flippase)